MSVLGETNADGEETVAVIGSGISGLASACVRGSSRGRASA